MRAISLGPDAVAAGRDDAIGIQCIFDALVEFEQRVVVVVIAGRHIVHIRQVRAVLPIALLARVFDQRLKQLPHALLLLFVIFAVEDQIDVSGRATIKVERAGIVEAELLIAPACALKLLLHQFRIGRHDR